MGNRISQVIVVLGVALGLLSLHVRYDLQNVIAVANPLEHMLAAAASGNQELAGGQPDASGALATTLAKGVLAALAKHSFVLQTSHRPTLLLEWLAIGIALSLGVVHLITTPAGLSVTLPCPSCGETETVRATLRSRVVKDQDGSGHLALRVRSPKAEHVCGQLALGLAEGARTR